MKLLVFFIASFLFLVLIYEVFLINRRIILSKIIARKTTVVQQPSPNASRHILVIGDSTAYGTGAEKREHSLVGRLARDYPDAHIDNFSENGMSLAKLFKKLNDLPFNRKYDLIMIHIGGIDVISMTPSSRMTILTRQILKRSLLLLKKPTPKNVVFVSVNNAGCAPAFRFPLDQLFEKRSKKLRDISDKICRDYQATHVALFEEKPDDPLAKDPQSLYAKDGIHPNDNGYGFWYDKVKSHITKII